jgi:hypothetical protein
MIATLAIQLEACLQEEIGAQHTLLASLEALERAARTGSGVELEQRGSELAAALAPAGAREDRRRQLVSRLATALGLNEGAPSLTTLGARLAAAGLETARLEGLRVRLRDALHATLGTNRRLAALAHFHRGVLEEIHQMLASGAHARGGHLLDAQG